MKRLLLLLSAVMLSCSPVINTRGLYRSMIMAQIVDANNTMIDGGSAFAIGNDMFLTAAHVCAALTAETINRPQMMYFSAANDQLNITSAFMVVKKDEWNDLCLVKVPGLHSVPFKIAPEDTLVGDMVYSYGCASGLFGFLSSGFMINNEVPIMMGKNKAAVQF
jgi:S1-C subfamily serine protease